MSKLGVPFPMMSKEVVRKSQQTYLNKTGYLSVSQDPNIIKTGRYYFDNVYFSSSIEIAYYIWLKDNKIRFIYNPKDMKINYCDKFGKKHTYFPDFYLIDEKRLVELKGDNHFDPNTNTMINISNRNKDYIAQAKYECMIKNDVKIIFQSQMKDILSYCQNLFGDRYWYKKYRVVKI